MNSKNIWQSINGNVKQNREDAKIRIIKNSFEGNINYEKVYKDFDPSIEFDTWIYDDKSERLDSEKKFIQMHPDQSIRQGEYIHWKNPEDIWIVRGVDTQYDYVQLGLMYKCIQERMTWVDRTGKHRIPIYSESKVLRDPLLDNGKVFLVDDSMEAFVQKNSETLSIKENYRFTFGQNTIFKVIEVVDFYIDNTIKIILKKDENLERDDFINRVAYIKDYSFDINPSNPNGIEGNIGDTYQLSAEFIYDKENIILSDEVWTTDDIDIATVDSSGLVTFNGLGVANITVDFNGLEKTVEVECKAVPEEINYMFEPTVSSIPIGKEIEFTVKKMDGGTEIALNSSIDCLSVQDGFEFTNLASNTFSIKNNTALEVSATIEVTDTDSGDVVEKDYRLRMW